MDGFVPRWVLRMNHRTSTFFESTNPPTSLFNTSWDSSESHCHCLAVAIAIVVVRLSTDRRDAMRVPCDNLSCGKKSGADVRKMFL